MTMVKMVMIDDDDDGDDEVTYLSQTRSPHVDQIKCALGLTVTPPRYTLYHWRYFLETVNKRPSTQYRVDCLLVLVLDHQAVDLLWSVHNPRRNHLVVIIITTRWSE